MPTEPAPAAGTPDDDGVEADCFDGRSARPRRVRIRVTGGRFEVLEVGDSRGDGVARHVALSEVRWDEATAHGGRQAVLPDGTTLHPRDAARWDTMRRSAGVRDVLAVRASRSWRATVVAIVMVAAVAVAAWIHGVPIAATAAVTLVPESVERRIGDDVAASLVGDLLAPSRLPAETRQRITAKFTEAVTRAFPDGDAPNWRLDFFRSRIGPNAFALPGGRMVMTDELVRFAEKAGPDGDAMLVGVLAHELGHVRFRHGLRGVAQAAIAGLVAALVFGDVSSLVAAAPVLLLQQGYSRDFERESDRESVRILRAAGLSPAVMADFFERMARAGGTGDGKPDEKPDVQPDGPSADRPDVGSATRRAPSRLDIALSSHPADAERIRFFREAAAGR